MLIAGRVLGPVVRAEGGYERLHGPDLPLGVDRDGCWHEQRLRLEPGDLLAVFSDGLFDLLGGTRDAINDLAALVARAADARQVVDEVTAIAGEASLSDDVTLSVIRRLPEPPAG